LSSHRHTRPSQNRELVAQEAARLMVESGIRDFQLAKRKALERLRLPPGGLPGNDEIERAVQAYQRLFRADSQPLALEALREIAITVMQRLERFDPKLVGAVLSGTADEHSEVCIHLFADTPEEIAFFLMDHRIRYDAGEQRVRVAGNGWLRLPVFRLLVDDMPVELVAFCGKSRRDVPLSPVDGRPMRRAGLPAVRSLI
jgi:hypothetical protein